MFRWLKSLFSKSANAPKTDEALRLFRAGRFEEALRRTEDILAVGPRVALSWRFKAECLEELERYREALECFQTALEIGGPGTEDVPLRVAMMEFCCGDKAAASRTLQEVLNGDAPEELKSKATEMMNEFSKY